VFYVVTRRLSARLPQPPKKQPAMPTTGSPVRPEAEA
jgi:hypothetical protein